MYLVYDGKLSFIVSKKAKNKKQAFHMQTHRDSYRLSSDFSAGRLVAAKSTYSCLISCYYILDKIYKAYSLLPKPPLFAMSNLILFS